MNVLSTSGGGAPAVGMIGAMSETALETTAPTDAPTETAPDPAIPADTQPATPEPTAEEVAAEKERAATEEWLAAEKAWQTTFDPDWTGRRVDFHGDYLAVITPTDGAYAAVSLVSSKYVSDVERTDLLGGFVHQHLGSESYSRFISRMMSPVDGYGDNAFAEFAGAIAKPKDDDTDKA